jgi:hypothetical protein
MRILGHGDSMAKVMVMEFSTIRNSECGAGAVIALPAALTIVIMVFQDFTITGCV